MRLPLAQAFFCMAVATAQTGPADWQTATVLPNVSLTGLTAAEKKVALDALRGEGCVCGCGMKVAECRIKDPSCAVSRGLSDVIMTAVRAKADPLKAVAASDIVKRASKAPSLLEDPISLPISGAPAKGSARARVTLVEFSDFECPFCSGASAKIDAVMRAYPNDVRLVYKQFPLPNHPHARMAAEASLAAQAQDKFWPMHDKLFANFRGLSEASILQMAKGIGLDMNRFQTDWKSPKVKQAVKKDLDDGAQAQISGTPTLFINGKRLNGAIDLSVMKPLIDAELKTAKEPKVEFF